MRLVFGSAFVLIASIAFAQQPPNCPLGGVVVATDGTVWACRGSAVPPSQVPTGSNADYATAAQGTTANSALQPAGNGSALTGLTKSQVGLSNVDNTSDANKPVSSAAQTDLNGKQDRKSVV